MAFRPACARHQAMMTPAMACWPTSRTGSAARESALLAWPARPAPLALSTGGTSVMTPPSRQGSHHVVERQQDGLELGVGLDGGPAALGLMDATMASPLVEHVLVAASVHRPLRRR